MKKAKKAKRGPGFIPTLVLIVLIAVVGIELVQLSGKLKTGKRQLEELQAQSQQVSWENDAMRSDLSKADDPEFILQMAQDKFGYLPSNAHQFIDVNGGGN